MSLIFSRTALLSAVLISIIPLSSSGQDTSTDVVEPTSSMALPTETPMATPTPTVAPVFLDPIEPLSDYNRIPNSDGMRVQVARNGMGGYHSIALRIPYGVITAEVTSELKDSDNLICSSSNVANCRDIGGYHGFFTIPDMDGFPYKTVQVNWNPRGHVPPGVFDVNHWDLHFHKQTLAELKEIRPGACGAEFVDCTYFENVAPLPANQLPEGYNNDKAQLQQASVPWMGSHHVHLPSFPNEQNPFTHVMIQLSDRGRLTGQEPMITVAFMQQLRTDTLQNQDHEVRASIPQPEGYEDNNAYPTQYVMKYLPSSDMIEVSLTGFKQKPLNDSNSGSTVLKAVGTVVGFLVLLATFLM